MFIIVLLGFLIFDNSIYPIDLAVFLSLSLTRT